MDGTSALYRKVDSDGWEQVYQWPALAIRSLKLRPESGWLYALTDSEDESESRYNRGLQRSKDGGRHFDSVLLRDVHATKVTAVGFANKKVVLGCQNDIDGSYLATFVDDGGENFKRLKCVMSSRLRLGTAVAECAFVAIDRDSRWHVAGACDADFEFVMVSADLRTWKLVLWRPKTSVPIEATPAVSATSDSSFVVNGAPGVRLTLPRITPKEWRAQFGYGVLPDQSEPGATADHQESATHTWGTDIEANIRQTLLSIDPAFERELANGYYSRANPTSRDQTHLREALVQLQHDNTAKDAPILDYGCGTGHFLLMLAKFGFTNLHGWDLNPRWLDAAQTIFERLHAMDACSFRQIDANQIYELDERTEKFDAIFMFGLIYGHGIELDRALDSAFRTLTPGGLFAANDNAHEREHVLQCARDSGFRVIRTLEIRDGEHHVENLIYFCRK